VYLNVGALAFVIMGAIWILVRYVESRGEKKLQKEIKTDSE